MRCSTRTLVTAALAVGLALVWTGGSAIRAADGWVNVTGNLAHKMSQCGTLTVLSAVPDSDSVIAGVASRGLWINAEGSKWTHLGDGPGSDRITNRATSIVYDPLNPAVFWESGIYNDTDAPASDNGIFKTTDGGKTFKRMGRVAHNDYLNVDFADPKRQTLLAGGHEQSQTVYLSTDDGGTWTNIGGSIPAGTGFSTYPFLVDSFTFLVNAASGMGGTGGIFRSRDAGRSWQRVSTYGPSAAPLRAANGVIYLPMAGALVRSADGGTTWTSVGSGLRAVTPVELPDHRIVGVGDDFLMISSDTGATWREVGAPLPYHPDGLIYSPQRKAFFVWKGECKTEVARDAVMSLSVATASTKTP